MRRLAQVRHQVHRVGGGSAVPEGEELLADVAPDHLVRFLAPGPGGAVARALQADLATLAEAGLVEAGPGGRWRLTERGAAEGGRRFADEFEA